MTERRLWGSTKCGDLQRRSWVLSVRMLCMFLMMWSIVETAIEFLKQQLQLRGGVERGRLEYAITEWAFERWICREDNAWLGRWKNNEVIEGWVASHFFFKNRDFFKPPKKCAQRDILRSVGLVACQNHQKLNTDRRMLLFLPWQLPLPSVRDHWWEAWHMTSLCTCVRQDCCFQFY